MGCVAGLLRFHGLISGSTLVPAPTARPCAGDFRSQPLGKLRVHPDSVSTDLWPGWGHREKAGVAQVHVGTAKSPVGNREGQQSPRAGPASRACHLCGYPVPVLTETLLC